MTLCPARPNETDEERRLREAINRQGTQLLATLDAAIRLRQASNEAQRQRARAKNLLGDFATTAMTAFYESVQY